MEMYPLQTIGLTKRFRNTAVLDRVSIAVREGQICGLVGVNGAGKTTTIKILMNILQPNEGHAEVLGRDSRLLARKALTRIGYVSENQELPGAMTVAGLLAYLKPFYPTWNDALAQQLLRQFELPPGRKIRHLSHGMRMKTALVSTLAYQSELLILDEPFTGLDPLVRNELIEGVLANAGGATMLVSSHDLAELESFATQIAYLDSGRVLLSEGMTTLSQRFREIEVILSDQAASNAPPLSSLPGAWLHAERSANRVRFVESCFEHDRTIADIGRVFGAPVQVGIKTMALLPIFLTLAKAARRKT